MNVFVAAISIVVVLGLAFFFVLTVTGVGQVLGRRYGGRSVAPASEPAPAPPALDPAAQELRMRYARGEISREEYLQRRIDLEEY